VTRWYRSTGDLLVVALWSIATAVAVLGLEIEQSLLRALLVTPLVIFLPGYALVEALFPERAAAADTRQSETLHSDEPTVSESHLDSISRLERVVLAVVVSLGLVPLVAFVVNYTPYGLRLRPIMVAVVGVTVLLSTLGVVRRRRVPGERRRGRSSNAVTTLWSRYVVGERGGVRDRRSLLPRTNGQRVLNLLLVVSLLVLAGSVGYAALTPPGDDTGFTEAYLVTQNDTGEYTSENLPSNFTAGESTRLFVALGNHEHERTTYTVVLALDERELGRFDTTVAAGETQYVEREITPKQTADSVPLQFLVYQGDAPKTATSETAYRTVKLWISVE
jgi:uncharacterized membrane protein